MTLSLAGQPWNRRAPNINLPIQTQSALESPAPKFSLNAPALSALSRDSVTFSGRAKASQTSGNAQHPLQRPHAHAATPTDPPPAHYDLAEQDSQSPPDLGELLPDEAKAEQLKREKRRKQDRESKARRQKDPVIAARIKQQKQESARRVMEDPVRAKRVRQQVQKSIAKLKSDPEKAARLKQQKQESYERRIADPIKGEQIKALARERMAKLRAAKRAEQLATLRTQPAQTAAIEQCQLPTSAPLSGFGLTQGFSLMNITPPTSPPAEFSLMSLDEAEDRAQGTITPPTSLPTEVAALALDEIHTTNDILLNRLLEDSDDGEQDAPSPITNWMSQAFSWAKSQ